jgi:hypothetical protein
MVVTNYHRRDPFPRHYQYGLDRLSICAGRTNLERHNSLWALSCCKVFLEALL